MWWCSVKLNQNSDKNMKIKMEMTTEHPCSHYGIPVLLVNGNPVGPKDEVIDTDGQPVIGLQLAYRMCSWSDTPRDGFCTVEEYHLYSDQVGV